MVRRERYRIRKIFLIISLKITIKTIQRKREKHSRKKKKKEKIAEKIRIKKKKRNIERNDIPLDKKYKQSIDIIVFYDSFAENQHLLPVFGNTAAIVKHWFT